MSPIISYLSKLFSKLKPLLRLLFAFCFLPKLLMSSQISFTEISIMLLSSEVFRGSFNLC